MKTKFSQKRIKSIGIISICLMSISLTAQNFGIPPQQDYLSVIKGTFEYVLFSSETELDSLDPLDHALFKQREIIEKEIMAINTEGRKYSETETLWYDGYPMWREPFWKLRREANYSLMYKTSSTLVPDTSYNSELSDEFALFTDSVELDQNINYDDYYKYVPFTNKLSKNDNVTEIEEGVFEVVMDDVTTIFDNNMKSIKQIYSDHTIKEFYTRNINGSDYLSFRIESIPFQLRNGATAKRMIYSRFSNYQFSERESNSRSADVELNSLVRIYPNPSAEELTIEIPERFQESLCKLEIFDISGKRCLYQIINSASKVTLTLNNFLSTEGVYILRLSNKKNDRVSDNFYFSKS